MKIRNANDLLNAERKKNAALVNQIYKQKADLDYVAMMAGVELGEEEESNDEQEV